MARLTREKLISALSGIPLNGYPNRLRHACVIVNHPQHTVAAAVGLHLSALSQMIRGQRVPTDEQKVALATYFDVPLSVLFPAADDDMRRSEVA